MEVGPFNYICLFSITILHNFSKDLQTVFYKKSYGFTVLHCLLLKRKENITFFLQTSLKLFDRYPYKQNTLTQ